MLQDIDNWREYVRIAKITPQGKHDFSVLRVRPGDIMIFRMTTFTFAHIALSLVAFVILGFAPANKFRPQLTV